jgi:hypothetical protein
MRRMQSRPELRDPVLRLLADLVPATKNGGSLGLVDLVCAVAGDRIDALTREKITARGPITFTRNGDVTELENQGADLKIVLSRYDLKIPKRIAGTVELHEDGVLLAFDSKAALAASKLLLTIRFVSIALTSTKIVVKLEQSMFNQEYSLV